MAWLSRNDFLPSDVLQADDLNNLANDIRFWGGDVNGGGHHLYNVILDGVSAGVVASVFGRTGTVVAAPGDYTAAQVINAVDVTNSYPNPPWIASLSWSKIIGTPPIVNTVFGRTGTVVAAPGDYTAAQVTNAVDQTASYTDPAWIASIPWSKITAPPLIVNTLNALSGAVVLAAGANITLVPSGNTITISSSGGDGSGQTPWLSDIDAAGFSLNNAAYLNLQAVTTGITFSNVQNDSNHGLGGILFYDLNSTTGQPIRAGIQAVLNSATPTKRGADLQFYAVPDSGTSLTERMRLTGSGNLGIGISAPAYALDVAGDLNITGTYRVRGVPLSTGGVTTVFGRSGAVVAAAGDYSAAQVTNAVSTAGAYADPPWITSLAWSKITGAPSGGGGGSPPGADTQIAYNKAGAWAADAGLTYDYTNVTLTVTGAGAVARQLSLINQTFAGIVLRTNAAPAQNWYIDARGTADAGPAGRFSISGGGLDNFTILPNGSVGINTATILGGLTVNGGNDRMLNFRGDPASWGWPANTSGIILQPVTSDQSNATAMTIVSNGLYLMSNVGIGGIVAPPAKLTIYGAASNQTGISIKNGDVDMVLTEDTNTNAGKIQVLSGGTASSIGTTPCRLSLQPEGGNVGIGTSGPNVLLEIVPHTAPPSGVANATQFAIREWTNNQGYGMLFGYYGEPGVGDQGSIQVLAGGGPAPLVLNAQGGAVGIGCSHPAIYSVLDVRGGRTYISNVGDKNTLGLMYNAGTSIMFLGADAPGNLIVSDGAGTTVLTVNQSNGAISGKFGSPALMVAPLGMQPTNCPIGGIYFYIPAAGKLAMAYYDPQGVQHIYNFF